MENVTELNVPHKEDIDALELRFCEVLDKLQPSSDVILAALANFVTFLTMDERTRDAYDYVVTHARDASGDVWIKRATPKPTTVTPFAPPRKDDPKG